MRTLLKILSVTGLFLTIFPSLLVFMGVISMENHKIIALIGSLIWFGTAPFWLNKKSNAGKV